MRRVVIPVLMIMSLLLSGCSESERNTKRIDEARAKIAEAESMSFLAAVCAEMEDTRFECVLRVSHSGEETVIEVVEPELIAGIRARVSDGDAAIEYDGMILALGGAWEDTISPIAAMPMLIDAVTKGYIGQTWTETQGNRELIAAQSYISDQSYMQLWFDGETMVPVNAELVVEGKVVVKCAIEEFTTN